ncbi:general secretion pathway protein GspB [Salicola sp. Rm-C-2C1-2]|uniref:general secretion pathway protein GspB n=1 Tax=Salicola sp. Rm-C-2C1-2 TaxID=3141321 RepID=UPI0032E475A7
MSYILDALKKSEAERSNTDPEVAGHRVSFASTPGKHREIWPYLLAVALMANAAVVAYLVWPDSDPGNEAEVAAEPVPVPSPQPEEETTAATAPEPPDQENARADRDAPAPSGESTETGSAETDRNPPENVPPIHDMPRSVQRRVPEMTFNGHVWSSTPSSRKVMINNRMLGEGARVGELIIEEITPAGVVFRLDQHLFQMAIVRDWQGGS